MEDLLAEAYCDLIEKEISPVDLYIYHRIITEGIDFPRDGITNMIADIKNNFSSDWKMRSLDYFIEQAINEGDVWDEL